MTFTQIELFLALAETKNFSSVAARFGISQSAVSHSLSALEKELGVQLFFRDRAGTDLTHVGQTLKIHATNLFRSYQSLWQEAKATQNINAGILRIGSIGPSTSVGILPNLLQHYKKQYPNIEIQVEEEKESVVERWITERFVDVGFVVSDRLKEDDPRFTLLTSWQDELLAVIPNDHQLAKSTSIQACQFKDENILLSNAGCADRTIEFLSSGGCSTHVSYYLPQLSSVIGLVKANVGVSIVSKTALEHSHENVLTKPLAPPQYRKIYLACRHSDDLSPAATRFAKLAKQLAIP
jgi:DNA-binding transcriptional LysR family regulator